MKSFLLIFICSILVYSGGVFFNNDVHASTSDNVSTIERDDGWGKAVCGYHPQSP